ncbi:MAG: 4-oxalocrotonate tautomerase [Bacillota bacterium]|nr:4-oxalocrotonate tautomerase [Bacillota bacterium]
MPIVQIEIVEGRTLEQKRELSKKVTEAIVESINVPQDAVKIIIREMKKDNYSEGGILRCDR